MLFEDTLASEVGRQQEHWQRSGTFAVPARDFISIHASPSTFPSDLRQAFLQQGKQEEYAGAAGHHYHVARFRVGKDQSAFAVAEVSEHLAVRPLKGELLLLIALGGGLILVAALILGYWLAKRATAPLSRLVTAVSESRSCEVPRISAASFPNNEIGILASTLEQMLDRTRAFVDRETRFTRDASHELRTPLSVIRTSAELIESRGDVPIGMRKPLRRISDAVSQMEQSIDLLLLLGREERAQSPSAEAPLLPLLEKIVLAESARYRADAFDVRAAVSPEARIWVNESVATAVLSNLIGNVFKHTSPGVLCISVVNGDVLIADEGTGIPADLLSELRREQPQMTVNGRSGLGLSIVWRLCRVHGIEVDAESGPGGTTVRVGIVRAEET
jgi:signal transduction histidine kinase